MKNVFIEKKKNIFKMIYHKRMIFFRHILDQENQINKKIFSANTIKIETERYEGLCIMREGKSRHYCQNIPFIKE
jgi:hypothetical protein